MAVREVLAGELIRADIPCAGADPFECAVREHERRLLGLAWRLLGSSEDARDVVQEVFLKLYRQWGRMDGDPRLAAWLYRVTMNQCFDLRRRRSRMVGMPPEVAAPGAGAEAEIEAGQRRDLLLGAIARLPEREREAVVLREIEGLSTAEAAEAMGTSEITVRTQVSMARARLRKWIAARLERQSRREA